MRTFLFVFLAMLVGRVSFGDITQLRPETRALLRDSRRFAPVASLIDLPSSVRAIAADDEGRLAAPGQRFEATDAILDTRIPRSRLRWAVRSPDGSLFLLHYERGGIGLASYVVLAAFDPKTGRSKIRWSAVGDRFTDYSAFARALGGKTNLYDHAPYFTH
jgi:hypothetical protein